MPVVAILSCEGFHHLCQKCPYGHFFWLTWQFLPCIEGSFKVVDVNYLWTRFSKSLLMGVTELALTVLLTSVITSKEFAAWSIDYHLLNMKKGQSNKPYCHFIFHIVMHLTCMFAIILILQLITTTNEHFLCYFSFWQVCINHKSWAQKR